MKPFYTQVATSPEQSTWFCADISDHFGVVTFTFFFLLPFAFMEKASGLFLNSLHCSPQITGFLL